MWASPMSSRPRHFLVAAATALVVASSFADVVTAPVEIRVGERLSQDIRFTHFFAANAGGKSNVSLIEGDPSQDYADSPRGPVTGAFAGLANNCRSCHPATEYGGVRGNRAYADMAKRSPVEFRPEDGRRRTVRNSPAFVDIGAEPAEYPLFHFDGEFASLRELVVETMAGRNYGWLPSEHDAALKHIVKVIREDDGSQVRFGIIDGSYDAIFRPEDGEGTDARLPKQYRLDLKTATDARILERVGELVEIYMLSLRYSRDDDGVFNGSPYDAFLEANRLPRRPEKDESGKAYARRLLARLDALRSPVFIDDAERTMRTFMPAKPFKFDATALAGLKVFLREPDPARPGKTGVGNCAACHTPPAFTDFKFHNTGITQLDYDAVHGPGAFGRLAVPGLAERNAASRRFLPPSGALPDADGPFFDITRRDRPGRTDLGLWNVFGNPGMPRSQPMLRRMLAAGREGLSDDALLAESIGRFKTPGLRLLGQSDPYMHDGSRPSVISVIHFYQDVFEKAARGGLRNGAPELNGPHLDYKDKAALAAFLETLNEDYE